MLIASSGTTIVPFSAGSYSSTSVAVMTFVMLAGGLVLSASRENSTVSVVSSYSSAIGAFFTCGTAYGSVSILSSFAARLSVQHAAIAMHSAMHISFFIRFCPPSFHLIYPPSPAPALFRGTVKGSCRSSA